MEEEADGSYQLVDEGHLSWSSSGFHGSYCKDSNVSSSPFTPSFSILFLLVFLYLHVSQSQCCLKRDQLLSTQNICPYLDTSKSKGYPMTLLDQTVGPGLISVAKAHKTITLVCDVEGTICVWVLKGTVGQLELYSCLICMPYEPRIGIKLDLPDLANKMKGSPGNFEFHVNKRLLNAVFGTYLNVLEGHLSSRNIIHTLISRKRARRQRMCPFLLNVLSWSSNLYLT